jgi:CHAD domain
MAANWTAVRRRLAIGRTAHRPPWGTRQAGHSSIVAPLTATLAATVAVGVGVALARAERTRRANKAQHARERRFTQLPGEPLGAGLRRMALGQLDLAIELLSDERGTPEEQAIHETRKALKRLRALNRLLRDGLGEKAFAREEEILRAAARRLAGARDAQVMVSTLDTLLEHQRKLARRRSLIELREVLVAEREVASQRALGAQATRAEVLCELTQLRARAALWRLPDWPSIAVVESDLLRLYRQGRRRHRYAARGKGGTRALHEWRKRVKDLRYAAEMLGVRALARRASELGEHLGEEHDLALLHGRLPAPGHAPFKGKRAKQARKALLKAISRRRKSLRKRTLREGERLYQRKPKQFVARVRRAHARASRV